MSSIFSRRCAAATLPPSRPPSARCQSVSRARHSRQSCHFHELPLPPRAPLSPRLPPCRFSCTLFLRLSPACPVCQQINVRRAGRTELRRPQRHPLPLPPPDHPVFRTLTNFFLKKHRQFLRARRLAYIPVNTLQTVLRYPTNR